MKIEFNAYARNANGTGSSRRMRRTGKVPGVLYGAGKDSQMIEQIHMKVPLHFMHSENCPGLKEGGVVSHVMNDVDIQCLPDDLPEYLEVDLSQLQLGHSIHVNELTLPNGVELVPRLRTDNPVAASVQVPREVAVEEPAAAAAAGAPTEAAVAEAGATDKKEAAK